MNPTCFELRIAVDDAQKDAMMSLLSSLGEDSFVEGVVDCDLEFDYEDPNRDLYKEMAHNSPILIYGEDHAHLEHLRGELRRLGPERGIEMARVSLSLAPLADQNWRDSWRASFRPIDIGGVLCILPPWEDSAKFPQKHKIVIDPGMAFGTGQHESTRLCLELALALPPARRALDVGTGSGVLAFAASMIGAHEVLGCDIDADSVRIAQENAVQNAVTNARFTDTPLHEIAERDFDLVFANIQREPLKRLLPDIVARVAPRGKLIFSGLLDSEEEEFCAALTAAGVKTLQVKNLGSWIGVLAEK